MRSLIFYSIFLANVKFNHKPAAKQQNTIMAQDCSIHQSASPSSGALQLRKHHPAWQLLAATKGPLMIAVLQALFKENSESVEFDTIVLDLAQLLRAQQENGEIECSNDFQQEARREIRGWIKRGLLQERHGSILATDALDSVLRFVRGLDQRIMSSSASRLAIVQREIEHLEASLNPNPEQRATFLKNKIAELEAELIQVEQGHVDVLPEEQAIESIREIYTLSISLSHDFRRVEDSYRDADHLLRQSIIAEQNHRGEIVDKLHFLITFSIARSKSFVMIIAGLIFP